MAVVTFAMTAGNDFSLPITLVESPQSLEFVLKQRFQMFLGEWFLDTREGVPYYRDILIKNPDEAVVRSIFRQVILDTQDIDSVRSLTIQIDGATRTLTCDFVAVATDGTIFDTRKLDQPFIIEF